MFVKILKKIFIAILAIIILLVIILVGSLIHQLKINEKNQELMLKTVEERIGTRIEIPRENAEAVRVNLYYPEDDESEILPVVFNIHGGAFVSGNADTLDSQSQRLADDWNCIFVTIDYSLAGEQSIEYALQECVDTVSYFYEHATEYNANPNNFVVMGYSAGGYYALASAIELNKSGIKLAAQVLCYPYIKDALEIWYTLTEVEKELPPALFVLAENDPISQGSLAYTDLLKENGTQVEIISYEMAMHGFIEENNPEYESYLNISSKNSEQEILARDAEQKIWSWCSDFMSNIND